MQLREPQAKTVQIKNISATGNQRIPASGRSANGSSVRWRSGEAAVDVSEAASVMAAYVILPSSFYLELSRVAASSLASASSLAAASSLASAVAHTAARSGWCVADIYGTSSKASAYF